MRLLTSGGSPALWRDVRLLGHQVFSPPACDWFRTGIHNKKSPSQWGDIVAKAVLKLKPDFFILNKGFHGEWTVPLECLWWIKRQNVKMVYISWDDPAATPLTLRKGIASPMDLWLTTCPGIPNMFKGQWSKQTRAKCIEFWLAHDNKRLPRPAAREDRFTVDVALTGSPYYRPFPSPHYQNGFGTPRAVIVRALMKKKVKVGLWGPKTWLDDHHGGDSSFKKIYKGQLHQNQIHRVHRSAKLCLGTQLVEGHRYESGRFPWVGGAGGCLVHEIRPGLRQEFGNRAAWFRPGNLKSCINVVTRVLQNPAEQERMRTTLHNYVMKYHTWEVRAKRLVAVLQKML